MAILKGLKVLDLACGSGYFTRLLKDWGAEKVVGVDISKEMIDLAIERERESPQGIEYRVGDITKIGKIEEFDVVFAGFLLHYSSSVEELRSMSTNIALNLKHGGRFIAFNENPFFPLHTGIKYGVEVKAMGELRNGTKIKKTFHSGDKKGFSFTHYHYEAGTYEKALISAGIEEIEWQHFVSADNLNEGFPADYWKDYLGDFSIAVLLGRKQ